MSEYYFVKILIPESAPIAQDLAPADRWMPSLIFYESDYDIKGVAMFSTWLAADNFRGETSSVCTYETEVCRIGGDGMPLSDYFDGVKRAMRSFQKALIETPIYVDPPDIYCKGATVSFNSFQKWALRCMKDEIETLAEPPAGLDV